MQDKLSDRSKGTPETFGHLPCNADAGQRGGPQQVYLLVRNMACPACAMRVRSALLAVDGVMSAGVLLDQGIAQVNYDAERVGVDEMTTAVMQADASGLHTYGASVLNDLP